MTTEREGCCGQYRKPCDYHQGWDDALDVLVSTMRRTASENTGAPWPAVLTDLLAHRSELLALLGPLSDEELAIVAEGLVQENDDLHGDLVKCLEVRGLALEEAATFVQPGPDGQDYIDRARLIAQWITTAYERHAEGEVSGHKAWVEAELARIAPVPVPEPSEGKNR